MDNHPIPQDVTGFQFKLIGNMTLKQFGYLAFGAIGAWIFYITPLFFLIKYPLAAISAGIGVSLAFLPFEGRPLDTMIVNFFKALMHPNQYVFQKNAGHFWLPASATEKEKTASTAMSTQTSLSGRRLQAYLDSLPHASKSAVDNKELLFFQKLSTLHANALQTQPASQPIMSQPVMPEPQPVLISHQDIPKSSTPINNEDIQTMLNLAAEQKKQLDDQLKMQQPLAAQKAATPPPPQPAKFALPQSNVARQTPLITTAKSPAGPMPLSPEFPNLVMGIVKDPRGNPLQNILVEIKDSNGNPVRAFKTNGLGQFASATSLPIGNYTISFEDSKNENKFADASFEAKNDIITPLEITSVDKREELRRSLFN